MSFSKDSIPVIGVFKAENKRRPPTHLAPENISNPLCFHQSGSLTFQVVLEHGPNTSHSLGRFQPVNADQDYLSTNAQAGPDQVGHKLDKVLKTLRLLNRETVYEYNMYFLEKKTNKQTNKQKTNKMVS